MRQQTFVLVVALAIVVPTVLGHCPNFCSGHGDCGQDSVCTCHNAWFGGDCSLRRCPFGPAWADIAEDVDVAHVTTECSAMGTCDHSTGICSCRDGFEGLACQRMVCPNDCSNHGRCRSMRSHAMHLEADEGTVTFAYSHLQSHPYTYNLWDADMIHGCECDPGFFGYDCSLRVCPVGDDIMTTGQLNEIQVFQCLLDDGVPAESTAGFYLTYKELTTDRISLTATAAEVEAALEALDSIVDVQVTFNQGLVPCDPTQTVVVGIEFLQEFGDVPNIIDSDVDGNDIASITWSYNGDLPTMALAAPPIASVTGTKENAVCSGRGVCDTSSGVCQCFTGYTTSNGNLALGHRADCGFAADPITACPGVDGVECSGHGVCSGFPAFECTCESGFRRGDCSERTCPEGRAWFTYPTGNEESHGEDTLTECSTAGHCDRTTGDCDCDSRFEGEACERISCPTVGGETCNGHGRCLSMNTLAEFNTVNGVLVEKTYGLVPNKAATWDWNKMFGCMCDDGYEGFDCSERSCPFGDDSTTHKVNAQPEIHRYNCDSGLNDPDSFTFSESFTFSFRDAVSGPLTPTMTAAEVEAVLEAMPTIDNVEVNFESPNDNLCELNINPSASTGNEFRITFHAPSGDVPASFMVGAGSLTEVTLTDTPSIEFEGTTEYAECSGRGLCNHSTGECACFTGFGSSDGAGNAGGLGECGYRLPYVPVDVNTPSW